MKICMFIPGWLPVHRDVGAGGIEVHVQQLVSGIIGKGHEITIIATKHPEDVEYEEFDGFTIFYAGNYALRCNSDYYKESIEIFNKINNKSQFDIVHIQDYAGYGYYKKYDQEIPSVVTAHGTPLNMLKSISRVKNPKSFPQVPHWVKYHLFVAPVIFHKSNKIISVSDELRNDIIFQYNISNSKITTVFHGIDTELFKPRSSNVKKEIASENEKLILFVGGLQKLKGAHLLIESLPRILTKVDAKLAIIGDGPYLSILKKTVNRHNIRNKVIFIEKVSQQALPDYYNAADIVVIPSIVIESAGLVVLESMSVGRPVIASRIGGIPSAIEHLKDGILVEPGNTCELSERILELMQNTELAENLGRAARNKVIEKFSMDRMIEQTLKIYEECIKKKSSQ